MVGLGWCWLCERLAEGDACDGFREVGLLWWRFRESWAYGGMGLGRCGLNGVRFGRYYGLVGY